MFRGICRLPVQLVDIIMPVGTELFQLKFIFSLFRTYKTKIKVEHQSSSNICHLLSAPDPVPCAAPVLARLVVTSKSFSKFLSSAILSLIVVSQVCLSRVKTRRFVHSLLYLG